MAVGIHVLCVDDDPGIRSLTATALEKTGDEIAVTTAAGGQDALALLEERTDVECVVSDYDMPGLNGLEFLEAVRERDPELPFILFTGKGSEEIASEAISAGVTDYLQKGSGTDQYAVLANRIENAVEKRRADRARRQSERELERYRTLVETVDDPMYVLDETGHCSIANEAFCALLNIDRDAVIGEHISTLISRQPLERGVKTLWSLYHEGGGSDRFEFATTDAAGEAWIGEANVTALVDEEGAVAGSTTVIRDITARKRRERELAQYERIIELAPISLFVLDSEATIVWCNDELTDAFAESESELLGTRFPELVERGYYNKSVMKKYADEVRTLLSSSVDKERAKYYVRFQSPDGEERIHDVHTKLLPLEDGQFTGTIHAIRDITQRRRSQRELERQNERLEEFASVVSHDLRNPLNVAQGTLELHAEECPIADGDSIEQVRRSLVRMDELIEDLLSLARHGRTMGEPGPVDLSQLVDDAWQVVDTADATLECTVDATVAADESRLRALFENLFRNAVEHGSTSPRSQAHEDAVEHGSTSPNTQANRERAEGGVTVTVGRLEGTQQTGQSEMGFYIADDGPGFETDTEDIFEFGHTTADDGTGLGLAIIEQIAEAHGWTVTAREGADGGARFEIRGVTDLEGDSRRELPPDQ